MQSMTGFSRVEKIIGPQQFTVELKSVNHRFLDVRFRLPPMLQPHESVFQDRLRSKLARGSVEISIRAKLVGNEIAGSGTRFLVDEQAARSFAEACNQLRIHFPDAPAVSLDALIATGKIVLPVEASTETPALPTELLKLVDQALDGLVAERCREGAATAKTLAGLTQTLRGLCAHWRTRAHHHPEAIRERLGRKVAEWNLGTPVDAARLEWEVAFFAQRSDISEEIQRFEAHLEEFSSLLQAQQPVGRKLDFLTQELHREVNTIASKADDLEISRSSVEAKTAIEKLREQVQNVE